VTLRSQPTARLSSSCGSTPRRAGQLVLILKFSWSVQISRRDLGLPGYSLPQPELLDFSRITSGVRLPSSPTPPSEARFFSRSSKRLTEPLDHGRYPHPHRCRGIVMCEMCPNLPAARAVLSPRQGARSPSCSLPSLLLRCARTRCTAQAVASHIAPPPPPHALSRSSSCLAYRVPFPHCAQLRAGRVARLARSIPGSCRNPPPHPSSLPLSGCPGRCPRTHLTMPYRPVRRILPLASKHCEHPAPTGAMRCGAHYYSYRCSARLPQSLGSTPSLVRHSPGPRSGPCPHTHGCYSSVVSAPRHCLCLRGSRLRNPQACLGPARTRTAAAVAPGSGPHTH
jgi:hypothetical protein